MPMKNDVRLSDRRWLRMRWFDKNATCVLKRGILYPRSLMRDKYRDTCRNRLIQASYDYASACFELQVDRDFFLVRSVRKLIKGKLIFLLDFGRAGRIKCSVASITRYYTRAHDEAGEHFFHFIFSDGGLINLTSALYWCERAPHVLQVAFSPCSFTRSVLLGRFVKQEQLC